MTIADTWEELKVHPTYYLAVLLFAGLFWLLLKEEIPATSLSGDQLFTIFLTCLITLAGGHIPFLRYIKKYPELYDSIYPKGFNQTPYTTTQRRYLTFIVTGSGYSDKILTAYRAIFIAAFIGMIMAGVLGI